MMQLSLIVNFFIYPSKVQISQVPMAGKADEHVKMPQRNESLAQRNGSMPQRNESSAQRNASVLHRN
ncbi:MAG: hypothetical protein EOO18_14045 [Chryseobacterium sp.]|nr:MAG: hypothetical protein EOO18_14045 [Chryseobacterium sp.]